MKNEIYVVGRCIDGYYEDWPEYQYTFYMSKDTAWLAFTKICHDIWDKTNKNQPWNEELIKEQKDEWNYHRNEYTNESLMYLDGREVEESNYICWRCDNNEWEEARIMGIFTN